MQCRPFYKAALSARTSRGLTGSIYYFFGPKVVKFKGLMQALCHSPISAYFSGGE